MLWGITQGSTFAGFQLGLLNDGTRISFQTFGLPSQNYRTVSLGFDSSAVYLSILSTWFCILIFFIRTITPTQSPTQMCLQFTLMESSCSQQLLLPLLLCVSDKSIIYDKQYNWYYSDMQISYELNTQYWGPYTATSSVSTLVRQVEWKIGLLVTFNRFIISLLTKW